MQLSPKKCYVIIGPENASEFFHRLVTNKIIFFKVYGNVNFHYFFGLIRLKVFRYKLRDTLALLYYYVPTNDLLLILVV